MIKTREVEVPVRVLQDQWVCNLCGEQSDWLDKNVYSRGWIKLFSTQGSWHAHVCPECTVNRLSGGDEE